MFERIHSGGSRIAFGKKTTTDDFSYAFKLGYAFGRWFAAEKITGGCASSVCLKIADAQYLNLARFTDHHLDTIFPHNLQPRLKDQCVAQGKSSRAPFFLRRFQ